MSSSWTSLSLQANQPNILDGANEIKMTIYLWTLTNLMLASWLHFQKKIIKGVTATESIYSSEHFKNFQLKFINYNDCDTYIFIDNAPIHAAKKIVELCAKANL